MAESKGSHMLIWRKAGDILVGDGGSLLGERVSGLKGKLGLSAWVLEGGRCGAEPPASVCTWTVVVPSHGGWGLL